MAMKRAKEITTETGNHVGCCTASTCRRTADIDVPEMLEITRPVVAHPTSQLIWTQRFHQVNVMAVG